MHRLRPLAALLGCLHILALAAQAQDRPNIVLLLADDLGWTGLRCFGSDFYETPRLDALAGKGVKFTQAYAACTVCSPTRASLMTGQYPARLHLTDFIAGQNRPFAKMIIPDWSKGLAHEQHTIAEALKAVGYRTGHVGKWHLNRPNHTEQDSPLRHGFDTTYDRPPRTKGYKLAEKITQETGHTYLTDIRTDKALEFITESKEQSFFLYLAYNVPHTPIQGRPDLVEAFASKTNPKAVHHNAHYAAMVKSLDTSVGRILDCVNALDKADNTLVFFMSDNGGLTQRYGKHDHFTENLPLRRGKGSAYEGGVRVPAIAHCPGITTPGTVCSEPIMSIDLYPTLLEIADAKAEGQHLDGRSLVPLLKAPKTTHFDRDLFWHYPHYHAGGDGPYSAIRSGPWRLIEFHENQHCALYNLDTDLREQTNLAARQADRVQALRGKLHTWRASVNAQMPTLNPNHDPARAMKVIRKRN